MTLPAERIAVIASEVPNKGSASACAKFCSPTKACPGIWKS